MVRIGLLSDTHGKLPPDWNAFFNNCDGIWHAGDIGSMEILHLLRASKPTRAVYGNIDGTAIRTECKEDEVFTVEQLKIFMTHIGGYPGHYNSRALNIIREERPGLFICGHSHILKVVPDPQMNLLHLNPGAAGNSGWHKFITMMRFIIDGDRIRDLEISETERKGRPGY